MVRPLLAVSIVLAVAACGSAEQAQDTVQEAATASAVPPEPLARSTMLAAAEAFENLTEAALAADPKSIGAELALARRESGAARPFLDASTLGEIARLEIRLSDAVGQDDPVEVSLAANEFYRLFITAAHGEAKIPLEIGLLDYVGFRYRADSRAQPPRWQDMAQAHAYAEEQWRAVRPQIADRQTADRFDAVIMAMGLAVEDKDARAAASAANDELEQVDVLEMSVVQDAKAPV